MPFLKGTGSRRDRQPAFLAGRSSIGGMEAFGTVLIAVAVVAIVVSCLSYLGSGGVYKGLGRTRMERRGEAPLDIDAEMAALASTAPAVDPGLRAEVRELVVAHNARRARRGEEPLDVESEVDRRLRKFGA